MYSYENYLSEIEAASTKTVFFNYLPLAITVFVICLIGVAFYVKQEKTKKWYSFFVFSSICAFSIFIVSFFGSLLLSNRNTSMIYDEYKQNLPIVWKEEKTESLFSLNTESQEQTDVAGVFFLYQVSSSKSTEYQYVLETEQGYQLRSLSDDWRISKDQIFLKEDDNTKPCLLVEKQGYEDERFDPIFDRGFLFSQYDRRCTFIVPTGTVKTQFKFN